MHSSPAVRLRGVTEQFGDVIALDGVDLDIARGQVQSVATSFAHLDRLQSRELGRPDVDAGPGNGWPCVVPWPIPGDTAVGTAIYQLVAAAEGRHVGDGDRPREVDGFFQVHTPTGDAPNPLWQVDGLVDLSRTPRKDEHAGHATAATHFAGQSRAGRS